MVGDQGEVAVVLAPAHLVDADAHEAFQPAGVQSVGDDSFAGTPDGVPVDAQDPGDGGLVGLRREVGHEVLEVAGEPGPVPGERHLLDEDSMRRAVESSQAGADDEFPLAHVQVPPRRRRGPGVVDSRRPVVATRAQEPAAAKRYGHRHDA